MDEVTNEIVSDKGRIEFLLNQFRLFTSKNGRRSTAQGRTLMCFDLIKRDFDIPAFVIMDRQFHGTDFRIKDRRDEARRPKSGYLIGDYPNDNFDALITLLFSTASEFSYRTH